MARQEDFIFQRREVAEFNTSQDSLRQMAQMEWVLDSFFTNIYSKSKLEPLDIQTLYNYLTRVYADRLYSLSWTIIQTGTSEKKKTKEEKEKEVTFENWEKKLDSMYKNWIQNPKNYPVDFIEEMRKYKRWLYEIKQKRLRLGIPTKTETTAEERFERVAGV